MIGEYAAQSFTDCIWAGVEQGAVIGGCVIGVPGIIAGGLIGAIVGTLRGVAVKITGG